MLPPCLQVYGGGNGGGKNKGKGKAAAAEADSDAEAEQAEGGENEEPAGEAVEGQEGEDGAAPASAVGGKGKGKAAAGGKGKKPRKEKAPPPVVNGSSNAKFPPLGSIRWHRIVLDESHTVGGVCGGVCWVQAGFLWTAIAQVVEACRRLQSSSVLRTLHEEAWCSVSCLTARWGIQCMHPILTPIPPCPTAGQEPGRGADARLHGAAGRPQVPAAPPLTVGQCMASSPCMPVSLCAGWCANPAW